jgi:hypothetical protein
MFECISVLLHVASTFHKKISAILNHAIHSLDWQSGYHLPAVIQLPFIDTISCHPALVLSHLSLAATQCLPHTVYCLSLLVARFLLPTVYCTGPCVLLPIFTIQCLVPASRCPLHVALVNVQNTIINKGKWTQDNHKAALSLFALG